MDLYGLTGAAPSVRRGSRTVVVEALRRAAAQLAESVELAIPLPETDAPWTRSRPLSTRL